MKGIANEPSQQRSRAFNLSRLPGPNARYSPDPLAGSRFSSKLFPHALTAL